jgi:prepilin-type processing-associated H-X9-DG protein
MYLDDYEGAYPFSWFDRGQYGFDVALYPYTKNTQVFACPSNPQLPELWSGYTGALKGMIRTYAMNSAVSTDTQKPPIIESALNAPADTIMMLETSDWNYKHTRPPDHETRITSRNDICVHVPFAIHQNGTNYIFADTHAHWARVEQTWSWWRADNQPLPLPDAVCLQRRQDAGG